MASTDMTKGAVALLAQTPVVMIEGREYRMRRLGAVDIIKWISMIRSSGVRGARGVAEIARDLRMNAQQANVAAVAFGLVDLAGDVTEWLASVLNVSKEEFENPELFPLPAHVDILEALVEHPDIETFVGKLQASLSDEGRLSKIMKLFGNEPSTPSNTGTDGQTSTS